MTDRRHCEGVSAEAQVSPCHRRVSCQSPGDKADQLRAQVLSSPPHHLTITMLLLVLLGLAALCQVASPAAASRLGDDVVMLEGAAVEDTAEAAVEDTAEAAVVEDTAEDAVEDPAEAAVVEDTADFHVDATNETEFAFLLEHNDQLFDPSLLVPLKRSAVPVITISDVKEIVPDQDGNNLTQVEGTEKKI